MSKDSHNKLTSIGDRIRMRRNEKELTQEGLASLIDAARKRIDPALGCSRAAVGQWEINKAKPEYDMVESVASVLNVSPAYIAFGIETDAPMPRANKAQRDMEKVQRSLAYIPEVVFGDEVSSRIVVRQWGLPADLLNDKMAESTDHFIMQVKSHTLSPEYTEGDRVFVDATDTRPSGGGAYAYWDGVGVAFGYMQIIPGKKPRLQITGEGVKLDPLALEDVEIIGKLKGRFAIG